MYKKQLLTHFIFVFLFIFTGCSDSSSETDDTSETSPEQILGSFMVASDMRGFAGDSYTYNKYVYFRGACETAQSYNPDFVILVGDQDPPEDVKWTIDQFLDVPTVFVIGNHDVEDEEDLIAMQEYNSQLDIPGTSNYRRMSDTTFSFDFHNSHFTIVDQYDGADPDYPLPIISSELMHWIEHDLKYSSQKFKFVFGHVPYISAPDIDTGSYRSYSLLDRIPTKAKEFWTALNEYDATAYFCGHSHMYSHYKYGKVWQINDGVALINTITDRDENYGAFVIVEITETQVILRAWRAFSGTYELIHTVNLVE